MATLLFKVGTLALRTASKPVANRFQAYVLGHPRFRQNVISIGQASLFAITNSAAHEEDTHSSALYASGYTELKWPSPEVLKAEPANTLLAI